MTDFGDMARGIIDSNPYSSPDDRADVTLYRPQQARPRPTLGRSLSGESGGWRPDFRALEG